MNHSDSIIYADAANIEYPLTLRVWKKGDYLYPLGMYKKNTDKPAKKKVSDVLSNLKIDLHRKTNIYVLCSGEKIIWIVGLRQDERFKISPSTKKLLKIKMLPLKGSIVK
ncbi:MAG: hypothetical protein H7X71_00215 [Chitinophagales bacterium]|nr:hypothetical protein [Chitinophagales bacterium]